MNLTSRRTLAIAAGLLIAIAALFGSAAGAQASTPVEAANPVTLNYFNGTGRTLDIVVFVDGGTPIRKELNDRETWKLPANYGAMNELTVRYSGDPNVVFLAHFSYGAGTFRLTDVVHGTLAYITQPTGKSIGIYFQQQH